MRPLKDLGNGIKYHPFKTAEYIFTRFSILFTLIKAVTHFFPLVKIEGPIPLSIAVVVSVILGLNKVWKPSKVDLQVANCNTIIEIVFGDLFSQDGLRVIGVNEFFDSKIGKLVSDKSLHGMLLQKGFGGHSESFDRQVAEELQNVHGTPEEKKVDGKTMCFPVGTTAIVSVNQDLYLLFALAKTDPITLKAQSDVELLWRALHRLWQRARIESGGHPVNIPLVGSGLAGLNLPTRDIVNLIVLSAITETKANEITQKIRIVLHRERFEDIDLRDVKNHWKEK